MNHCINHSSKQTSECHLYHFCGQLTCFVKIKATSETNMFRENQSYFRDSHTHTETNTEVLKIQSEVLERTTEAMLLTNIAKLATHNNTSHVLRCDKNDHNDICKQTTTRCQTPLYTCHTSADHHTERNIFTTICRCHHRKAAI